MHHLLRIYFKLCPNDNYFNSGEIRKKFKLLPRISLRGCGHGDFSTSFFCSNIGTRALETKTAKRLKQSNGNYNAPVRLSNKVKKKLCCWLTNVKSSLQHIHVPDPDIVIYTDSSTLGWGVTDKKNLSGSRWKADEINHINVFELKAILLGVQTYCIYKHFRVMSGIITAIPYENLKGGIKSEFCNEIAKKLSQNIWVSAAHTSGTQNTGADKLQ